MRDVLAYEGKRVVVAGSESAVGVATVALLVELGAEVHTIGAARPPATGIASFTECDLRDPALVDATVAKIGRVLNALFNCAPHAPFDALRHLTEAVVPLMLDGSAIVSVVTGADRGGPVPAYTADRSATLAAAGIRINCVHTGPVPGAPGTPGSPEPVAGVTAERVAWPLVLLNSPRSGAVTGSCLDCTPA